MVQTIIQFGACGIILGIMAQVALVLVSALTGRRQQTRQHEATMEEFRRRLEVLQEEGAVVRRQSRLSGDAWRKLEVEKKVDEGGSVCSFYLRPHDGEPLPPFKPGQFLTFRLKIDAGAKPVVRCYSLSDGPNPGQYRVSIKRVAAPRDKPDLPPGLVSNYFHDHIKPGTILDAKAPSGHFFLKEEETTPVVLLAGGIGITPLLSMVNTLAAKGDLHREVWMFLGVRNGQDHIMKDHLAGLAKRHEGKFNLVVCYSKPGPEDKPDIDFHHAGHLSIDLLKSRLPSNHCDFFVCGPPPMMQTIVPALSEWGVAEERIHFEAFGPATVKKIGGSTKGGDRPKGTEGESGAFEVHFASADKTCPWTADKGSVLDLAETHELRLDSGCRSGSCGTCLVAVREGTFEYLTDPDFEHEQGSCLACLAVPTSRLVVDA